MLIRKEKTLTKGPRTATIQIRYHSWEDDYGRGCWNNEVYYKLTEGVLTVEEKIVTPQQYTQLSDIFDCPPYFDRTVAYFKKQGFVATTN
jgi:hypothetical protein